MRYYKQFVAITTTIIGILTISSCVNFDTRVRPVVNEDTLITGQPCLPPCWYDILPESTKTTIVLDKIRLLEFVNPTSVEMANKVVYSGTDDAIRWSYRGTNDFGGGIYIADDTIKWFRVDHPNYLPLEDIITTIGEPDWVWAGRAGGAGNHHIYRFVFEKRGVMLESRMYGDNSPMPKSVVVMPDIQIDKAFYFAPRTLAQYLVGIRSVSKDDLEDVISDYQTWPGYGAEIRTQKDYPRTEH